MTAVTTTLTDTDLGVVAEVAWPDYMAAEDVQPRDRSWLASDVADVIRQHVPAAEVWFTADFMAIRQPQGPDVAAFRGDTLVIAAGQVLRKPRAEVEPLAPIERRLHEVGDCVFEMAASGCSICGRGRDGESVEAPR